MQQDQDHVLERGLGLSSIIAISMGAMIGIGIFILPGLAMAEAGPAVILSFILAGVLVLPAALSIAELGTAMPEAGGDYVFIQRGLGPGAGTIAGLGTWLMLMFKGALALVGGMFYLTAIMAIPSVEAIAVVIGTILIAVNIIGVKQTGGLQIIMVVVMVIILALFVSVSLINVEKTHFTGFFDSGISGLLSATVLVLISYGGVTKIAAVAEEIENPGRNLPLGLLLSLIVTTCLYALIVFVLVGLIDAETLAGSNIPMVDSVEPFFGYLGIIFIVVAAMLALISTANAGILTASRYPFALSRDKLIPEFFARVSSRFHTPVIAILITGGAMLAIIIALPVEEIAKTAGAFQIVVYVLVNIALIAFRVRAPKWYDPQFKSPFYPWIQIFGILSGVGVLALMDTLPLIGGLGILILGTIWYFIYGRKHGKKEAGVISEVITQTISSTPSDKPYKIVVPIANPVNQRQLLRIAAASASAYSKSEIIVVSVIVVPDQTSLAHAAEFEKERVERHESLIQEANSAAKDLDLGIRTKVIIGRNVSRIVINLIKQENADEVILGWKGKRKKRRFVLGSIIDPIVKEAPSKVMLVKQRGENIGKIGCFIGTGPHAKAAVRRAADLVKSGLSSTLTFINIQPNKQEFTEKQLKQKGEELIQKTILQANVEGFDYQTKVIVTERVENELIKTAQKFDTICIGATRSSWLESALFGSFPELVAEKVDGTALIVRDEERNFYSVWHIFKRLFKRY